MKIYISGKITGDPNYRQKFRAAQMAILATGNDALNPAEGNEGLSNAEAMRRAINMLFDADAVVMLPGWQQSHGAIIEHELARYLGKRVERMDLARAEEVRA